MAHTPPMSLPGACADVHMCVRRMRPSVHDSLRRCCIYSFIKQVHIVVSLAWSTVWPGVLSVSLEPVAVPSRRAKGLLSPPCLVLSRAVLRAPATWSAALDRADGGACQCFRPTPPAADCAAQRANAAAGLLAVAARDGFGAAVCPVPPTATTATCVVQGDSSVDAARESLAPIVSHPCSVVAMFAT